MHSTLKRTPRLTTALALVAAVASGTAAAQDVAYGTRDYLPVKADGARFVSSPMGESARILEVASLVQEHGIPSRIRSRGIAVPDKASNRILDSYTLTLPNACGGATFTYYEGSGFKALGYHHDGKVVLDTIAGGSPFSAPRLWGPYDQVLNSGATMRMVFGGGETGDHGLMRSSYMVGMVIDLPKGDQQQLGQAYTSNIKEASTCNTSNLARYAKLN